MIIFVQCLRPRFILPTLHLNATHLKVCKVIEWVISVGYFTLGRYWLIYTNRFYLSRVNMCPFWYQNPYPLPLAVRNPVFIWGAKPHIHSLYCWSAADPIPAWTNELCISQSRHSPGLVGLIDFLKEWACSQSGPVGGKPKPLLILIRKRGFLLRELGSVKV